MAGSIRLRGLQAGALIGALTAGPACVIIGADQPRYVEREEKRFTVSGKPDVSLSTFDGAIEVRTSDRPEVTVTIEKRAFSKDAAAKIDVRAEQSANRVTVDVRLPQGLRILGIGWNHASAKLIVTLPAASNVEAHSGDGSIDIERVTGTLNLRSGDGSIHGRQLTGDVKVHTGDGAIKLDEVTGALDADTGDGSINVTGRMTSLRIRTGDGSVTIRAAAGSTAEADWNITTGDGSVVLEMPEGFGGELDAHTGDGRIHMQDLTLSNVTGPIGKTTLRGRLGAGGHAVRVRTGDGSITLRRLAAERG
jgi:DUF4097 and DUF4098 domain-containing protein YvlB